MSTMQANKGKKERVLFLNLDRNMKGNGEVVSEMAMGFNYGRIMPSTKDIGRIIEPVAMVSSLMQTEMFIKDSGQMIRLME